MTQFGDVISTLCAVTYMGKFPRGSQISHSTQERRVFPSRWHRDTHNTRGDMPVAIGVGLLCTQIGGPAFYKVEISFNSTGAGKMLRG